MLNNNEIKNFYDNNHTSWLLQFIIKIGLFYMIVIYFIQPFWKNNFQVINNFMLYSSELTILFSLLIVLFFYFLISIYIIDNSLIKIWCNIVSNKKNMKD